MYTILIYIRNQTTHTYIHTYIHTSIQSTRVYIYPPINIPPSKQASVLVIAYHRPGLKGHKYIRRQHNKMCIYHMIYMSPKRSPSPQKKKKTERAHLCIETPPPPQLLLTYLESELCTCLAGGLPIPIRVGMSLFFFFFFFSTNPTYST